MVTKKTDMTYPEGERSAKPIKISRGLDEAIEKFLKTEKAHYLGYRFKSDVVNTAVRNLLEKYGVPDLLEESDE